MHMNIPEKCDINNILLFLCVFEIVNIKLSFELPRQSFNQMLFKELFFYRVIDRMTSLINFHIKYTIL